MTATCSPRVALDAATSRKSVRATATAPTSKQCSVRTATQVVYLVIDASMSINLNPQVAFDPVAPTATNTATVTATAIPI